MTALGTDLRVKYGGLLTSLDLQSPSCQFLPLLPRLSLSPLSKPSLWEFCLMWYWWWVGSVEKACPSVETGSFRTDWWSPLGTECCRRHFQRIRNHSHGIQNPLRVLCTRSWRTLNIFKRKVITTIFVGTVRWFSISEYLFFLQRHKLSPHL